MHVTNFCGKITKKQKGINMNIKQALEYGIELLKENNIDEPILKARILLANILERNKEYLLIHEIEELNDDDINKYRKNIIRLCKGEPVQYITNKQEFMGLEFYVDENVLIPQPDTEILVEEVIKISKEMKVKKILDLCTGSGAIAVSLAKYLSDVEITAIDISHKAIKTAKKNAVFHKVEDRITFLESDLFGNLKNQKYDLIVSNPPYIKKDLIKKLDKQVQKEPYIALDGGYDGLDFYRKIIKEAYEYLKYGGYLCLEIGYDQKDDVIDLINKEHQYSKTYVKKDLCNNDRVVITRVL